MKLTEEREAWYVRRESWWSQLFDTAASLIPCDIADDHWASIGAIPALIFFVSK